ncbi:hypothetical protein RhiirA5_380006 [Rhizophagus irregularis]|uniref:Uncharacterized protein n=2 Tax=Rhizophagus irregularis TaxID=588596 RepID=A0A2I1F412_9GLOM|nr:hypothetical protein GLOIN_2v1471648 [Rhizophagus irregularis DAOM 181602=DAOM 197198]PKC03635.1 hypothetical protein RhiirA5_380006 [Rhizophagus irregularis]PKY29106.1 hypothetical protein RhiirB3_391557 [Rhizophagus irregularis]POG80436.1 hypothetical protein GLOIN_2v1471648 [Rhizophagus irregularis DAOM 181602=DAOM 197198]|eukprot:XP_025187302.1 hypothetical protein GLOIN_2v1471648 [Rhizophagus irregularis DAOM 181602=DAOM 197198]
MAIIFSVDQRINHLSPDRQYGAQSLEHAYTSDTNLDLTLCSCRIWAEDSNGKRISGGKGYHDCSYNSYGSNFHRILSFPNQTYTVYAKVLASFEETKKRGPFTGDTCFHIHGDVDNWKFDQVTC